MDAGLADLALEAERDLVDPADLGVGVVQGAELAALAVALVLGVEELLERDALAHHVRRQRLGDPVADGEAVVEDAGGVLDRLLGLIRPKVAIWATRSAPYFSVTYWMTSPRRWSSKSMSKSGIEGRSGLRNRSKKRPCSRGHRSVIFSAYAASEPAPEPRPGPTRMPLFFDHWMKSATTRK